MDSSSGVSARKKVNEYSLKIRRGWIAYLGQCDGDSKDPE